VLREVTAPRETLDVGVIGYRNHAARILGILDGMSEVRVARVFHPEKEIEREGATRRLDDLAECDAVFILSPNATHAAYLDHFADYPGYVFCEKPPVTSRQELDAIRNDPRRTFFNFNMRYGRFAEVARACMVSGALGDVVFADAVTTHGLAFRRGYSESWRANDSGGPSGVVETVCVHYLDLFGRLFGPPTAAAFWGRSASGVGTAHDTARYTLSHESGCASSVTASWAAPFLNRVRIVGTDGILEKTPDRILLRGPRESFDDRGLFAAPPVLDSFDAPEGGFHLDSLRKSVAWFVRRARSGEGMELRDFEDGVRTMELVFGLEENR
jgi:predicted dehydrogenase